jgi:hypothetical protein
VYLAAELFLHTACWVEHEQDIGTAWMLKR